MVARVILSLFLFLTLYQIHSGATQISNGGTGNSIMTGRAAISILHARGVVGNDVELVAMSELQPSPDAQHIAQESLAEAQSKRLDLYADGLFIDLMRTGGVVVMEFDTKSGQAIRIHLVTLNQAGEAIIQSHDVHGDLARNEAQAIIDRCKQFSQVFFGSHKSDLIDVLHTFGGRRVATLGIPDGKGYLAIPDTVRKLLRGPEEQLELTGLSSGLQLWTIRHALTAPLYAANPIAAVQRANGELSKLAQDFQSETGRTNTSDFVDDLIDLNTIHTREALTTRLRSLKDFCSFLDERSPLPIDSAAYSANVLISTIPLELVVEQGPDRSYGEVTAPGLISIWQRSESGEFVLKGFSVAE
jgi:hypothetical protein